MQLWTDSGGRDIDKSAASAESLGLGLGLVLA